MQLSEPDIMEAKMRVYVCFPEGKVKAFTMSYDDGATQDVRLIEIMEKYGIKGTFNLNYGRMSEPVHLPPNAIKEIYKKHEVATHGLTHPTLARCSLVEATREILEDRIGLEKLTGNLIRGHAYPSGSYNEEVKTLLKQLGIAYARTTKSSHGFELPKDPWEWHPTCHHNDQDLMKYAEFFVNSKKFWKDLMLMYVWGHTYEFDDNHNWEVIENLCKHIGGRNDIWYATNIEIIDYLEALKNLKFSGNNEMVYNPSAGSVWLWVDDSRVVEVKGGTMLNLNA